MAFLATPYLALGLFLRYCILRTRQPATEGHTCQPSWCWPPTDCPHAAVKLPPPLQWLTCCLQDTVQRKCQAQAQAPKEVQELCGSFLPTNGLLCSRVYSAEGEMLFVHPSYSDHASLGTCHSPFTPSTSSHSAPCTTEGSCSSSEDKCASLSLDEAKQPGPTRLERQQAQCFAGARH